MEVSNKRLLIANNCVLLREIGGVYVFVPIKYMKEIGQDSFVLTNQVGASIWDTFKTPSTIEYAVKTLSKLYSVDHNSLLRDVCGMVDSLLKLEILIEV